MPHSAFAPCFVTRYSVIWISTVCAFCSPVNLQAPSVHRALMSAHRGQKYLSGWAFKTGAGGGRSRWNGNLACPQASRSNSGVSAAGAHRGFQPLRTVDFVAQAGRLAGRELLGGGVPAADIEQGTALASVLVMK
jgi:hypothetical protein